MMSNRVSVVINNKKYDVEVYEKDKNVFLVRIGEREYLVYLPDEVLEVGGEARRPDVGQRVAEGLVSAVKELLEQPKERAPELERGLAVTSKVPGRVVKLMVREGDVVEEGQVIAVVESMKMAIEVKTPYRGRVKKVLAQEKSFIDFGQPIALLEPVQQQ